MEKSDLKDAFTQSSEPFSLAVQQYLSSCRCDEDTKQALDEIARQCFFALVETQDAIMRYIDKN